MSSGSWSTADIPDLRGRTALVTGVTSGLGQVVARELAGAGAEVLLAARDPGKLDRAAAELRATVAGASVVPVPLDLADLASVRRAATDVLGRGSLDLLVNNAGVMATPHRRTEDGFELQLGTNHLGHFALTGLLFPALRAAPAARVVTVSSNIAQAARGVPLLDPREEHGRYRKWEAYAQSKLANLLFTFELDRRARAAGVPLTAVAAHPGYARTNLVGSGMNLGRRTVEGTIGLAVTSLLGQSAEDGAAPLLRAATDPGVTGGSYLGPGGPMQLRGAPVLVRPPRRARDAGLAKALWSMSETATGVVFP